MIILIFLGAVASIFQLAVLREFTFSIARNELSFIVAVGIWLISASLGSTLANIKKRQNLPIALPASAIFCVSIAAIHLVKSIFGLKYYESVSFAFALLSSTALIAPVSFILGFAFSYITQKIVKQRESDDKIYAKFFAFEAMGFFLGGVIFTFFLSDYSNPFIFSITALPLVAIIKDNGKKILSGLCILLISCIFFAGFNQILKKEFFNSQILQNLGSKYGPVISARKAGVTSIFASGSLIATSEDALTNEEFIHMSLSAAQPDIKKDILFIGSGISGEIREIAKYNINNLDVIQINPVISKMAQDNLPDSLRPLVNFIVDDPRAYLKRTPKHYDAIIMSEPAPANLALNRFFTREFFTAISQHLNQKGIFSFSIPSKREILSPQFIKFDSSVLNSLEGVFKTRFLIPSDSMIVIASNGQVLTSSLLLRNFKLENLKTDFFTVYNFQDYLNLKSREYVQNSIDTRIEPNTDLNPSGFLNYILLEQIKFYPDLKLDVNSGRLFVKLAVILAAILILILSLWVKKALDIINAGLIGFSSISLSAIIFVLFQQYCGALFWKAGLLIGSFMLGLSLGAILLNLRSIKSNSRLKPVAILYLLWAALLLSLLLNAAKINLEQNSDIIFYFYSLLCGVLTGAAYPLLAGNLAGAKFEKRKIAAFLYAADLCGAFLGTIACGILFIPVLGINNAIISLISLNSLFALRNLLS